MGRTFLEVAVRIECLDMRLDGLDVGGKVRVLVWFGDGGKGGDGDEWGGTGGCADHQIIRSILADVRYIYI